MMTLEACLLLALAQWPCPTIYPMQAHLLPISVSYDQIDPDDLYDSLPDLCDMLSKTLTR